MTTFCYLFLDYIVVPPKKMYAVVTNEYYTMLSYTGVTCQQQVVVVRKMVRTYGTLDMDTTGYAALTSETDAKNMAVRTILHETRGPKGS